MSEFRKDKAFFVALDLDLPESRPGSIVAVYWEEWDAGRPVLEGWRGPAFDSEDFARIRLQPYACENLMTDLGGYWDCLKGTILGGALGAKKPKKALRMRHEYLLEILGRRIPVDDMEQASKIVERIRDAGGYGVSQMGAEFPILEDGIPVGYVSYNGRVWKGQPGASGADLTYDPGAERQSGKQ